MVNSAEIDLIDRYQRLTERLRQAESHYGRAEGSVCLVAVSKTYPANHIRTVATQGQKDFGENQIQDAMTKIPVLEDLGCSGISSDRFKAISAGILLFISTGCIALIEQKLPSASLICVQWTPNPSTFAFR